MFLCCYVVALDCSLCWSSPVKIAWRKFRREEGCWMHSTVQTKPWFFGVIVLFVVVLLCRYVVALDCSLCWSLDAWHDPDQTKVCCVVVLVCVLISAWKDFDVVIRFLKTKTFQTLFDLLFSARKDGDASMRFHR